MARASRTAGVTFLITGLVAFGTVLLIGQGLDRAEKWVSLIGMPVSVAIALVGLLMAARPFNRPGGPVSVTGTGDASASGAGSRANTGAHIDSGGPHTVRDTGRADARDGGVANTGVFEQPPDADEQPKDPDEQPKDRDG
jgi:hypothetical protein